MRQRLDVYRPRAREGEKLPVIISVHGGGWVYGDKDGYQFYCMGLAERGFAVVNFSYRLAPEAKFPASLEDTNAVFRYYRSGEEKLGHVFHLNVRSRAAALCNDEECGFFRSMIQ